MPIGPTLGPKFPGAGGTHTLRHTGKRDPFHKNCEKIVKSAIFEVEKPSEMGYILVKIIFKSLKSRESHFTKLARKLQNQPFLR